MPRCFWHRTTRNISPACCSRSTARSPAERADRQFCYAGHPVAADGRIICGPDQAPAARVPDLGIFSPELVERISGGWRITSKGRAVLEFIEALPARSG
ncbi:hypothetical protein CWO90_06775 [Bradyrhizobium sp. Leo121]|nr:hypothetical protein CWO90_06775 [Bradyrhizobium sp. Leo121]